MESLILSLVAHDDPDTARNRRVYSVRLDAPQRKRSRAIGPTKKSTMETKHHRGALQWQPGRAWQLQEDVQNKM